jgi:cleavage and polyadenylation specificity factor subunit 3
VRPDVPVDDAGSAALGLSATQSPRPALPTRLANLPHRDKTVMFDCGIHPAFKGLDSLPLFDTVELGQVDVALITHFHLDHCAAVPYLLRKTTFKARPLPLLPAQRPVRRRQHTSTAGSAPAVLHAWPTAVLRASAAPHPRPGYLPQGRIFMTHPTKAIYYSLLRDLAKGAKHSSDEALFNEDDLNASMERIEVRAAWLAS